jgi:hypothetical protein
MPMQRTLGGEIVTSEVTKMSLNELKFFYKNPRVYSTVHLTFGSEPTQDEIFRVMKLQQHVLDLKKQIKSSNGLIEPVIVKQDTNEVVEGNSRLAAYKLLYDGEPTKWSTILCEVLPKDITKDQIDELIGSFHMTGKLKWDPYEQAAWLWRLEKEENKSMDELKSLLHMGAEKIKNYLKTYQFMREHNLTKQSEFSYYLVLKTNRNVQKLKEIEPNLDKIIINKIQTGEIDQAVKIRDQLPLIANSPQKVQQNFFQGKFDFDRTVEIAKSYGGGKNTYKKLKDFNEWLFDSKNIIAKLEGNEKKSSLLDMKRIRRSLDAYIKLLE